MQETDNEEIYVLQTVYIWLHAVESMVKSVQGAIMSECCMDGNGSTLEETKNEAERPVRKPVQ